MLFAPEVATAIFVALELGILFEGIALRFEVELSAPKDARHDVVDLMQMKISLSMASRRHGKQLLTAIVLHVLMRRSGI